MLASFSYWERVVPSESMSEMVSSGYRFRDMAVLTDMGLGTYAARLKIFLKKLLLIWNFLMLYLLMGYTKLIKLIKIYNLELMPFDITNRNIQELYIRKAICLTG